LFASKNHRHCFAIVRYSSPSDSPLPCTSLDPTRTLPLHRNRPAHQFLPRGRQLCRRAPVARGQATPVSRWPSCLMRWTRLEA
jgi:hypothetical protein